jgi:hypothetical protein
MKSWIVSATLIVTVFGARLSAFGLELFATNRGQSGQVYSVDQDTGQSALLGSAGLRIDDLAANALDGYQTVWGMGVQSGRFLLRLDASIPYKLFELDISSGATQKIGPSLIRPSGLAFAIPEPSGTLWFAGITLWLYYRHPRLIRADSTQ